jgi:hypothetical protein
MGTMVPKHTPDDTWKDDIKLRCSYSCAAHPNQKPLAKQKLPIFFAFCDEESRNNDHDGTQGKREPEPPQIKDTAHE